MSDALPETPRALIAPARRSWKLPTIVELPKLTDLTLASAIGGGGGTGGGGSTVFGLLLAASTLAVLSLAACSASDTTAPSPTRLPAAVVAVQCTGNVQARVVTCGGPLTIGPVEPDEIIGGQGSRVILRSSNVHYLGTDFTFDVTVQNVGAQSLGTDGSVASGVRVFFENDPVATGGSGAITVEDDSTGIFTASNQSYYLYTDSLPVHATSASVPWHFSVPGSVTTFTFQVLVSSQVPTHGALLRWQPIAALSRVRYLSVAWSGGNDAMAVGENGLSSRWNGTTWTPIAPVDSDNFSAVTAVSTGVYLAATPTGKILKYTGNVWTEVYASPGLAEWHQIWARDADHWYAAGANAAFLTYDNGTFTEGNLGGGEFLTMIAGTANNDQTVLASQQGAVTYVSTAGGPFIPGPSLVPDANWYLTAIAFDASGTLIRSEISLTTFNGYLIRTGAPDDTLFTAFGVVAMELMPFPADSVIASNFDFFSSTVTETKVRFGAAPHTSVAVSPALSDPSPFDVTKLNNAGTNFALIDNHEGTQTSSGGGAWATVVDPNTGPFVASWGQGDSVWVAEGSGELWKIVDGVATPLTGVTGAVGIWGFSGSDLYIIAGDAVYSGDGVGPWTSVATLPGGTAKQIWGDQATGTLIVTGLNSRYLQRVGGTWTEPPASTGGLEGIWGCDFAHVWIAGGSGQVHTWNPGGLPLDPTYTSGDVVRFLSGTGCSDVWAGGPNSALSHFDGVSWNSVAIAGNQIFITAVASQSDGVVYVAGEQSKVAMVNTSGITSRTLSSEQWDDIHTLWRLDNGDLFVGGEEHAILGRR